MTPQHRVHKLWNHRTVLCALDVGVERGAGQSSTPRALMRAAVARAGTR